MNCLWNNIYLICQSLFWLKNLTIDDMVGAWCFSCCQAHQGLPVGFLLLQYLVFSHSTKIDTITKWKMVKNELVLTSMLLMSWKCLLPLNLHVLIWPTPFVSLMSNRSPKWNLFVRVMEHMTWLVRFSYAMLWLSWYYGVKLMFDRIKQGIKVLTS